MEYGAVPQLLQLRGIDALGQEFICSAVSLGMGYVLTAGHCVVDVTELQVLRGESTYAVQEVELHPGYRVEPDVAAVFDDLAILVVPDLDIPGFPILLSRVPELGETLLALGVGLNSEGEFGVPQAGQVLLSGLTPNHAVSTFKEGFANPCVGDSGGPLLYQFVDGQGILQTGIVGIVSSGAFEDCRVGDTSLYTYLSPERTSFLMSVVPALGVL